MRAVKRKVVATQLWSEGGGRDSRWRFCPQHGVSNLWNLSDEARCPGCPISVFVFGTWHFIESAPAPALEGKDFDDNCFPFQWFCSRRRCWRSWGWELIKQQQFQAYSAVSVWSRSGQCGLSSTPSSRRGTVYFFQLVFPLPGILLIHEDD